MRVSDLLELLAHGATIEEIVTDFPALERDDVLAAAGKPIEVSAMPLIIGRRTIMGSCTGGRGLINEMLEFAARHQLGAQVERFKFADANKALDFVRQGNPRYRAVLEA